MWDPFPEPGVNLDLENTLQAVSRNGESVTMWGPFQILPQVYERSLRVKAILDSGSAEYRAISTPRNLLVSDCIHAVAAVDPVFGRGHYPLIRVGKPASRYIARQVVNRSVFDQNLTHAEWLIPRARPEPPPDRGHRAAGHPPPQLRPVPVPGLATSLPGTRKTGRPCVAPTRGRPVGFMPEIARSTPRHAAARGTQAITEWAVSWLPQLHDSSHVKV